MKEYYACVSVKANAEGKQTQKGKRIGVGTKVVLRRKFNCGKRKSGYGSTGGGVAAIEVEVHVWELQF